MRVLGQLYRLHDIDLTMQELCTLLGAKRRRRTMRLIVELGDCSLREAAGVMAEEDHGSDFTSVQRTNYYNSLCQAHGPKLDDWGLVDFDERKKAFSPNDSLYDVVKLMNTMEKLTDEEP